MCSVKIVKYSSEDLRNYAENHVQNIRMTKLNV